MMGLLVISTLFALSFLLSVLAGPGVVFIGVYLPTLILLNQIPVFDKIPHVPITAPFAPLYAILLSIPFRGESLKLRWCSIDSIMVLLLLSGAITGYTTEVFETAVNTFRNDLLTWFLPYFVARVVFRDLNMRLNALRILTVVIVLVFFFSLIEFRLSPYFYLHMLQSLGMGNKIETQAYHRWGFNRVAATVEHPIYFGNMCMVILGTIAVLARTSGKKLTTPWVALALLCAFGCLMMSISFTPYVGTIAGTVFFLALIVFPFMRKMLIPLTLVVFVGLFSFTYKVATERLGEKPEGSELAGSLYTRRMIIGESWKIAQTAGPFGHGLRPDFEDVEDFDLKSVDNSYMQFAMTRGWVYVVLWISIGLLFSVRMSGAFKAVTHKSQIFPLAVATATILGLMVSMYTVWAGGLYTVIWMVLLGLANTLIDMVRYPQEMMPAIPASRGLAGPQRGVGFMGGYPIASNPGLQIAESY